jgi:fermentation-respiration switch protein FrsA (DUF1100 family)
MDWLWILLACLGGVLLLLLSASFICFLRVFYAPRRKHPGADEYPIPEGDIYEVFREDMVNWTKMIRTIPHEEIRICSDDGLTLVGTYFEHRAGAPVELLFHGYRGTAERDLNGGVERCFSLGHNALIIDHRAHGKSDGHVITFGIRERFDCLRWIDYAVGRFGPEVKLILTGVSMGAATVMMATGEPLPPNVVMVLADCGYTSPKEIISKVMRDIHLSPRLFYPLVKLGAKLFGGFDLEETSALDAMERCRVPLILIHGDADDFVPFEMSAAIYEACSAEKRLVSIAGAGHGLAFPVDRKGYVQALAEFQQICGF